MKKVIIVLATLICLFTLLTSCNTEEQIDSVQETAYDIGYDKGYDFGYAAGYVDSANGENMNVFSEIDNENMDDNLVFFIVGSEKKIYHKNSCTKLIGKQYSYFENAEIAEAAGFDPCSECL